MALAVGLLVIGLASIQAASSSFDSSAAASGTLPTRVSPQFASAVYAALEAAAPAAYVETALAQQALASGTPIAALHHALRLPAGATRDDLLARIAAARGDRALALEYFLAAPDPVAFEAAIDDVAVKDPTAAYALERTLSVRLAQLATHPDALAQARWRMGQIANQQAARELPAGRAAWLQIGMRDLQAAAAMAPLSNKYAIAAANQAIALGEPARARELFAAAVAANPGSADAIAGLGVSALHTGDRHAALTELDRARRVDPNAAMVRALERALNERR